MKLHLSIDLISHSWYRTFFLITDPTLMKHRNKDQRVGQMQAPRFINGNWFIYLIVVVILLISSETIYSFIDNGQRVSLNFYSSSIP